MIAAISSAAAALLGTFLGSFATLGSTWLSQRIQIQDLQRERLISRREELFSRFVEEAARLYGDALSHEKDDIADLVTLYAILARIKLVSSLEVVEAAESTLRVIIDAYLAPNRTLREIGILAANGQLAFLYTFSDAARRELTRFG